MQYLRGPPLTHCNSLPVLVQVAQAAEVPLPDDEEEEQTPQADKSTTAPQAQEEGLSYSQLKAMQEKAAAKVKIVDKNC